MHARGPLRVRLSSSSRRVPGTAPCRSPAGSASPLRRASARAGWPSAARAPPAAPASTGGRRRHRHRPRPGRAATASGDGCASLGRGLGLDHGSGKSFFAALKSFLPRRFDPPVAFAALMAAFFALRPGLRSSESRERASWRAAFELFLSSLRVSSVFFASCFCARRPCLTPSETSLSAVSAAWAVARDMDFTSSFVLTLLCYP